AEDGIRDRNVTGVQTCALPISMSLVARLLLPAVEIEASVKGAKALVGIGDLVRFRIGARQLLDFEIAEVTFRAFGFKADKALSRSEERRVGKEGRCR